MTQRGMSDETAARELARQIETYSNAIVAFAVLQALGYSYSFGTSKLFNCLVKTADYLALGLTLTFVLVAVLMVIALIFLRRTMQSLSGEYAGIVKKIYRAKLVAVVLASMMPIVVTVTYGVRDYQGKHNCAKPTPPAHTFGHYRDQGADFSVSAVRGSAQDTVEPG